MANILNKLRGGDRRSIGQSEKIAQEISEDPGLFSQVFDGMLHDDPLIRMRAADAIEKATAKRPELLQPYKDKLLRQVAAINQQEVRWHVAQMLTRLRLNSHEQDRATSILLDYLKDKSRIVKTCSMQALAGLAIQNPRLRAQIVPLLDTLTRTGSPAMQSRGRKLLVKLRLPGI